MQCNGFERAKERILCYYRNRHEHDTVQSNSINEPTATTIAVKAVKLTVAKAQLNAIGLLAKTCRIYVLRTVIYFIHTLN